MLEHLFSYILLWKLEIKKKKKKEIAIFMESSVGRDNK